MFPPVIPDAPQRELMRRLRAAPRMGLHIRASSARTPSAMSNAQGDTSGYAQAAAASSSIIANVGRGDL
jgi:hypothetical protein